MRFVQPRESNGRFKRATVTNMFGIPESGINSSGKRYACKKCGTECCPILKTWDCHICGTHNDVSENEM